MQAWNGSSTATKNCAFCGKVTSDYIKYEVKGIEIQINAHIDCKKDLAEHAKECFRTLKKEIRKIK